MGLQGPGLSWWNYWSLTDPHPGQYFSNSSKPWFITTVGLLVKRPYIYPPFERGSMQSTSLNKKSRPSWLCTAGGSHWRGEEHFGTKLEDCPPGRTVQGKDDGSAFRDVQARCLTLPCSTFMQKENAHPIIIPHRYLAMAGDSLDSCP
jgi:hypothetical protein